MVDEISYFSLYDPTGIVPARMLGIRAATARIFVILDSHIEVSSGTEH